MKFTNAKDRVLQRCAVVAIFGRKNAKFRWTTPFVPNTIGAAPVIAEFHTRQIPSFYDITFRIRKHGSFRKVN
ncbi:MAG: hypothetical protein DWI22_11580 [Planctomycetota bacterium]|nr:MAG: hypothetical protein DWI22_11580 [Planctomycetota bacterium]